jgi:hypothetical protein
MNILEFIQQSQGKWFSQRTYHDLAQNQSSSGRSNLQMELLTPESPEVRALCDRHQVYPETVWGIRTQWEGSMDRETRKQLGSTVLVLLPDSNPDQGEVLSQAGDSKQAPMVGRFILGADEALTLTFEQPGLSSEERLWFASPNLRLRTSILKQADGSSIAGFCSEIRMLAA